MTEFNISAEQLLGAVKTIYKTHAGTAGYEGTLLPEEENAVKTALDAAVVWGVENVIKDFNKYQEGETEYVRDLFKKTKAEIASLGRPQSPVKTGANSLEIKSITFNAYRMFTITTPRSTYGTASFKKPDTLIHSFLITAIA